jgi:monooxygenase
MAEQLDVIIVGAGIAGISAAWHMQAQRPQLRYAVLESRRELGGTWSLHKYPGVRCDSDMYTLGFRFHPWTRPQAIADGADILDYLREAATASGIGSQIQYDHQVLGASWSSQERRWTVRAQHDEHDVEYRCRYLFLATGYYRYDEGYIPPLPGLSDFSGPVMHPQTWPEHTDLTGRRVAVIGSGATAMTLAPTIAKEAAHVTLVQRSPSYVVNRPRRDRLANIVLRFAPTRLALSLIRAKNILGMTFALKLARSAPDYIKKALTDRARKQLPAEYPVDPHFSPRYRPWENRLCLAADGDVFEEISRGRMSMSTGAIQAIEGTGIRMVSGDFIDADVLVTATGFNMRLFGGIDLDIDGVNVNVPTTVAYKGMMLTGVPNVFFTVGYQASTYTLKAELVSAFACRVIKYMSAHGYSTVTPQLDGTGVEEVPFTEYVPGYIARVLDELPRQGSRPPWRLSLNYFRDWWLVHKDRLDSNGLIFDRSAE